MELSADVVAQTEQQHVQAVLSWRMRVAAGTMAAASVLSVSACSFGSQESPRAESSATQSEQAQTDETFAPALPELEAGRGQDVLAGNWALMPGTTVQPDKTLLVQRTWQAEALLGGGYVANPPLNLSGTHVETTQPGTVGFSAHLSSIEGAATLSLRSAPPVRMDESITPQPGVDVVIDGAKVHIKTLVQVGSAPTVTELALTAPATEADVAVAQTAAGITISVNGVRAEGAVQLFDKQVWFGFDSAESFTVDSLKAYPLKQNSLTFVDMNTAYPVAAIAPDGLKALAAAYGHGDKLIGTAADLSVLASNPAYTEFILNNFNSIESELLAKPQALQPEEGKFEFAELDALVAFANKHGISVHGHTLIFAEANPQWLLDKLAVATPEQATALMQNHIQTIVSRYDGQHGHGLITDWDVVNEPFDPDEWENLNAQNPWYKALGEGYIATALQMAKAANPIARVGINDWALETDDDRWDAMVELAGTTKPDFIGFQAHFDEDTLDDDEAMEAVYGGQLADRFAQLAELGIGVRVSEASVAEDGDPARQARVYELLLKTCLEAPNCLGFNMWGASNSQFAGREFYFTGDDISSDPGDDAPTTQDAAGTIVLKPAWAALLRAATS